MSHSAPKYAPPKGEIAAIKKALGKDMLALHEANGEIAVHVKRGELLDCSFVIRAIISS
jgi:NADH-quinone oxidoreductase subunit C